MDSITVSNYRCFGERSQTARLAPLTLFVGENSSGKTSLLAMIRALWDTAFADRIPDFKEEPYDLGTFDEILHHPAAGASRAPSFTVSCEVLPNKADDAEHDLVLFDTGDEAGHGPFKTEVEFGSQWSGAYAHQTADIPRRALGRAPLFRRRTARYSLRHSPEQLENPEKSCYAL